MDMKERKRRIARVRMALGAVLLLGALWLAWVPARATRCDLPRFGYDAEYITDDETVSAEPHPLPLSDLLYTNGLDLPLSLMLSEMIFSPPQQGDAALARREICPEYLIQLEDFQYLRTRIFLEDPSTMLLPADIDVSAFVNADLRIDPSLPGPHVLIFHTHSTEWFVDTDADDPMTGIMGAGKYLAQLLSAHYGLEVLHHTGRYDIVDGRAQIRGAYERMEPVITALLAENPQIQLVIDLHRDGVREGGGPFTHQLNGVPTARLMFFNGLSRSNNNGVPIPVAWLPNPFLRDNLMFSLQAQLAANELFPGLNRRIYLRSYRFSLHMHPRTLFVEVGNQYNTLREAKNAMYPLARIIAEVVLAQR
jgi:stage II sporulation protein P